MHTAAISSGLAQQAVTYGSSALVALQGSADLPSQFLTFLLNDEPYAIGILHIKEIIEYGNLAAVPMMPPCVRGVINLRGAVVEIASDEIEAAPSFGTRIRPDFIAGIGKSRGKFVILLDINRVLASEEIIELTRGSVASHLR